MMKIKIWQQFSSNHSAAFSIVAKFETAEKAKAVAAQITEMLLETYRWKDYELAEWQDNPNRLKHQLEHNVSFGTSWMLSENHVRWALQVIGNTILVSDTPGYSNFDGTDRAFITLFEELGGDVIASQETSSGEVEFNLTGEASSVDAAAAIIEHHILEVKSYNGLISYVNDLDANRKYLGAKAVRREERRISIDGIYASFGFDSLVSWYSFARAYQMTKIQLQFQAKPSMKSLEISLDRVSQKQLLWEMFETWSDTVEMPGFAVAEFESESAAEKVAVHLREVLRNIQNWSRQNPVESLWVWEAFWERLSPVEQSLKSLYSLDWSMSAIEWIHHCRQAADFIVVQIDKRIFLGNFENSWIGIVPFNQVLKKLGALQVDSKLARFDFEIATRSAKAAQELYEMIERKEDKSQNHWVPYYRDYDNHSNWQDDMMYLRLQDEAAKEFFTFLEHYGYVINSSRTDDYIYVLVSQRLKNMPDLFDADTLRLKRMMRDCDFSFNHISVNGKKLIIEGGRFEKAASLLGLEAFVKWLRAKEYEVKFTLRKV